MSSADDYKVLTAINETHEVYLVQNIIDKKIYVKKILHVYDRKIYDFLLESPIYGTPGIIELFEDASGLTVIEEYISGKSLDEIIAAKSLTTGSVKHYLLQLCHIVNTLHKSSPQIVHRDIKPSNILIDSRDNIYLLDFNAAKFYSNSSGSDTRLLGTHGYAAPEQYGFGSSSEKTDIYGIGMVLKEMLASCSSDTSQYEHIVSKCTMINPDDRYKNIDALILELEGRSGLLYCDNASYPFYLLPGFRSKSPFKMLIATLGYGLLIYMGFTLDMGNSGISGIIENIFICLALLSVILCSFNYMNIQKIMPLCRLNNRIIRYLGIIILDILSFISVAVIYSILTIAD